MKRIFLRLKQRFCKHQMKKVAIETRERKLINAKYISKKSTYEIHQCTKCGKRMYTDEAKYGNYVFNPYSGRIIKLPD